MSPRARTRVYLRARSAVRRGAAPLIHIQAGVSAARALTVARIGRAWDCPERAAGPSFHFFFFLFLSFFRGEMRVYLLTRAREVWCEEQSRAYRAASSLTRFHEYGAAGVPLSVSWVSLFLRAQVARSRAPDFLAWLRVDDFVVVRWY